MGNKKELQRIIDELPKALKSLLDAELAAGNEITEVGHSYPAPPIGAYIKLAKPVSTRPNDAKGELTFREHDSSLYSGEYTDSNRRFFIVIPPKPQLKATLRKNSIKLPKTTSKKPNQTTDSIQSSSVSPLRRFEESMEIDYEKWHDGIGYDIDAIRLASPTERKAIEQMLILHTPRDWRDIEALAEIDTISARETMKNAMKDPNPDVRIAVTRFAPNLVTNSERSLS